MTWGKEGGNGMVVVSVPQNIWVPVLFIRNQALVIIEYLMRNF